MFRERPCGRRYEPAPEDDPGALAVVFGQDEAGRLRPSLAALRGTRCVEPDPSASG